MSVMKNGIVIATTDGHIMVKKIVGSEDQNVSFNIRIGQRFLTPPEILHESKKCKATYHAT